MATISIIVAMSNNRVIGKNDKLPWYIPEDLQWFKDNTMNKPVIMGRKTHESIGKKLPGRLNIVVSRNKDYEPINDLVRVYSSLEDVIVEHEGMCELFVIGGAEIYKEVLPYTDKMYITRIAADIEGDTFFPEYNEDEWNTVSSKYTGNKNYFFEFKILERK